MNEEKMEVMEITKDEDIDVIDTADYTEVEGGSGKVVALVVGGLVGATALGVAAYKKLKAKKEDKPKKKRKKLMWVEVEDEIEEQDAIDSEAEEVYEDSEE